MRKTTRRALGALAAVALTTACAGAQQLLSKNISVGGVARSYLVYLPVNFDPSEAMPAMFFFHGGGGTANGGLFECDFRPLADAERFIAVYPQAIDSVSGSNCWDCLGDYYGGVDEVGFLSAMIDALEADVAGTADSHADFQRASAADDARLRLAGALNSLGLLEKERENHARAGEL